MSICLNMIVKDESHVIKTCLEDVHKFIDYYVIVDTGSTDDTPQIIRDFFNEKRIKGEVIVHDFKTCKCHGAKYKKSKHFNFAHNRTYALEKCKGKSDYIMIMDADDCIEGKLVLPKKLEADQYYFTIRTDNNIYYKPLLIKNHPSLQWKWYSGLHEYLDGKYNLTVRLMGDYAIVSRRLGNRNKDPFKYLKDIEYLEELIADEPKDSQLMVRYKYYYAQSLFDAQEYTKSINVYTEVMNESDDKDRQYSCHYMIGRCHVLKKSSSEEIERVFLDCYLKHKHRAEPLFQLLSHFNQLENYKKAYEYGVKAVHIPIPTQTVFYIDKTIYDYKLYDELVYAATHIEKYSEALQWSEKLLTEKKYPPECHENVVFNINYLKTMIYKTAHKNTQSIRELVDLSKPFLCFYVGPSPMFRNEQKFGSELAVEYLAAEFTKTHNVFIAADECPQDMVRSDIFYINSQHITQWRFNVMIVSRYVAYFLEFDANAISEKTFMWLHDVDVHNYWRGSALTNRGIPLVRNIDDKVTAYITLSPWHAEHIHTNYGINKDKILVIGNGLAPSSTIASKKIPGKFVWMSDHNRGLLHLIDHFPKIIQHIPHAHIEIFRDLPKELADYYLQFPYITLKGHATNQQIMESLQTAEYWFYPTDWHETYCISALEAQYAGCITICSDLAALTTTVGDRGILLKNKIHSEEYWKEAIDAFIELESNPSKKAKIIKQSQEWARMQTWSHKSEEWQRLFNIPGNKSEMFKRLNALKKFGFDPTRVIDIGANTGNWNFMVQSIFPNARITSIEANPDCAAVLKARNIDYKIVLLGEKNKSGVPFYIYEKCNLGASVFKEQTLFYDDPKIYYLPMQTLDQVYTSQAKIDLMKLDVQGSEIQILKGGMKTLENTTFVLLEASLMRYNKDAPLISDIIAFMDSNNFKLYDIIEHQYINQCCLQVDLLFLNTQTEWPEIIAQINSQQSNWKVDHIFR